LSVDTRLGERLRADSVAKVEYALPVENLRAVLARLRRALPPGEGVLVANDWIELAMCSVHDPGRTVIQILHGDHDYYYDLAAGHEMVIDAWIAYGEVMHERLRARLPHRRDSMFLLPYGIPLPPRTRAAAPGPLRLLYLGRVEHGQKGVLYLPAIDARLAEQGVPVTWTVAGDGPDARTLRERWRGPSPIAWVGARPNREALTLLAEHDVIVLPSHAEGVPLTLVEGMAAGLVPVASDLASGVAELVEPGVTGCRVPVGDVQGFAAAIAGLHRDREGLEALSARARARARRDHDIRVRAPEYQALFARWRELRRPRPARVPLRYGSRLDRPWLPNAAVSAVRRARRALASRRAAR
jgi:glycosyltransferase involved in cell wall biosynthesis